MRKLVIELSLPPDITEELLTDQLQFAVRIIKEALEPYKEKGMKVPVVSIRTGSGLKKHKMPEDYKGFSKELIDLHLKYQPKTDIPPQMAAIKRLYEAGYSKEQLIDVYEKSRTEWALTSWFTVVSVIAKNKTEPAKDEFVRSVLDDSAKEELKKRLTSYGTQTAGTGNNN